jgi:hypothetical protein
VGYFPAPVFFFCFFLFVKFEAGNKQFVTGRMWDMAWLNISAFLSLSVGNFTQPVQLLFREGDADF